MMSSVTALSYHEPDIVTILILASFVLLLNVINRALDRFIYCGLIGQILLGVLYGAPGAKWLSLEAQNFTMQFGYLGLILLVYEGGLSTNLKALRANIILSCVVAFIGIGCPIALSFILRSLLDISPLQAFAAGAALCSTSLGTTFTVLNTSGLTQSRLGIVLTSAAMMDDVVGLVMVQVISNLGGGTSFEYTTVVRPLGVSLAFAIVLPLSCRYAVEPGARWLWRKSSIKSLQDRLPARHTAFLLQTLALVGLVTGATYAGTSGLFAAYLVGVFIVWWDGLTFDNGPGERPSSKVEQKIDTLKDDSIVVDADSCMTPGLAVAETAKTDSTKIPEDGHVLDEPPALIAGYAIYEHYYKAAVDIILKPFFFASIGFSIPITKMFSGEILWRGLIYALLMLFGKLLCGVCLIRISPPHVRLPRSLSHLLHTLASCGRSPKTPKEKSTSGVHQSQLQATKSKAKSKKPLSLYPAAILGSAMVARGEIGFLISSVAESNGIFRGQQSSESKTVEEAGSELFLVVTWAILLCTIIGPVTVGLLVKRVKRLQNNERQKSTGREDPLGVWGIVDARES